MIIKSLGKQKTFTLDTLIKSLANTKTFKIDTLLKKQQTKTALLDLYLEKTSTKAFSVDAYLQKRQSKTFSLDVLMEELFHKSFSIDLLTKKTNQLIFGLDLITSKDGLGLGGGGWEGSTPKWKTVTLIEHFHKVYIKSDKIEITIKKENIVEIQHGKRINLSMDIVNTASSKKAVISTDAVINRSKRANLSFDIEKKRNRKIGLDHTNTEG